jgi:hypothetical protein
VGFVDPDFEMELWDGNGHRFRVGDSVSFRIDGLANVGKVVDSYCRAETNWGKSVRIEVADGRNFQRLTAHVERR